MDTQNKEIPLLLTTQQASRYLAGVDVFATRRMDTSKFLEFATANGIEPKMERATTAKRNGETYTYTVRRWSKRQIDAVLQ